MPSSAKDRILLAAIPKKTALSRLHVSLCRALNVVHCACHLALTDPGVQSLAVLLRRDSDQPNKRAAHYISAPKPAVEGDLFEDSVCSFELTLRFFDPHLKNVFGGRPAQLSREYTLKIANTHGDVICK